ncbi:MAG: response regulator transcription factor [Anaerolineaceae bacterium]|nr:response regulator transcription factor [Anaerolineaceae bacterium]
MKILVIDDDVAMTDLVELILETVSIDVIKSNSAQEGLLLAKSDDPEMIILDLMMPDIDGWQMCKKIREFSSVPILILSALDSPGLVAKALDLGADDFLVKPISKGMLIANVNKMVRRNNFMLGGHRPTLIDL